MGSSGKAGTTLTTKGDVQGFSTSAARIPVGGDGQVLTSRSSQALGLDWEGLPGGGFTGATLLVANGGGAGQTLTHAVHNVVTDWAVVIDQTTTFASGVYTCPSTGYYLCLCCVALNMDDGGGNFSGIQLLKNGTGDAQEVLRGQGWLSSNEGFTKRMSGVVSCAANDLLRVSIVPSNVNNPHVGTSAADSNLVIYRMA